MAAEDNDQRRLMGIVSQESERLNKLVSDFLLYSREQRFEFREVNVLPLIEETLLLLGHHPSVPENCHIERNLPRHPVRIEADADKLRQVFWNICDNALKAMPDGGRLTVEVNDRAARVASASSSMIPGLAFRPRKLKNSSSLSRRRSRAEPGWGLPSFTRLLQGHGGHIQVDSSPGRGAKFVIAMPPAVEESDKGVRNRGSRARSACVKICHQERLCQVLNQGGED